MRLSKVCRANPQPTDLQRLVHCRKTGPP